MTLFRVIAAVVLVSLASGPSPAPEPIPATRRPAAADGVAVPAPAELRSELERRAVRYFVENAHPDTGMVLDAAPNFGPRRPTDRMASVAATGFGLAVVANAARRGLLDESFARAYALRTVRFMRDRVERRRGWFTHFVDWETGRTFAGSEFSTIDTALFLAGALYAAQVFPGGELAEITRALYVDVDFFDMMTDGGALPAKRSLSMAYFPNGIGYNRVQWDMYAEQMILLLLGLGHPTRPLPPHAWTAWSRERRAIPGGESLMGADQPLFVHQYSPLFVDLRGFRDSFGVDYFANGSAATRHNRDVCASAATRHRTFAEGFWGLSAGLSPRGYRAYGPADYDGTVCIGCALGSAMYDPAAVLADAGRWMTSSYANRIWGRYGFVDSINVDENWFAEDVLGITVGPAYLSLANAEAATSIWRDFARIPEIRTALARAAGAANGRLATR